MNIALRQILQGNGRITFVGAMLLSIGISVNAAADPKVWLEQGPGPILGGQTQGNLPVAGAINAIAVSPTDPDLIFVGAVNGGVWRTNNGTAANPTWEPLTDKPLPGLSINSLAISPVRSSTLFAGTGSTSSFGLGSPGFGVARSNNGGKSWAVLASSTFAGRSINSIVPTALSNGNVVLAATLDGAGGVFRSIDLGDSFAQISGAAGSGLPAGGISNIVRDPGNPNRFYAGLPFGAGGGANAGVYRSTDGGVTWTAVNSGLTGLSASGRILLSVHSSISGNVVYAALIGINGKLSGVFRSTDQGGSWVSMVVPAPEIFPGGQGSIHGAIIAHPTDVNLVFISGDRQNSPFPNANGCTNFTGNTFLGNASLLPGNPWTSVDCNGANATSPHADSRVMAFDASGDLLQANDGGIYRLKNPKLITRQWSSSIGNIRPTELHSVAYDPLSNIVFGGAQDTGTSIQSAPGSLIWNELLQADGGNVAVDSDQNAHSGTSIRYTSFQFFGFFNRTTWDTSNNLVSGPTAVGLHITSGPGTGNTLLQVDPNVQFYQPFVLNAINPSRMLIGTANIYESLNKGDSLANLGFTGFFIHALAYGGRINGVANPDVFYVGAGPNILHRLTLGGPVLTLTAYPGSSVRGLVIDPQNYQRIFVLDNQSRVWASFDKGVTWSNLTTNLALLTSDARSIEIISYSTDPKNSLLVVGGLGGVFQLPHPGEVDDFDDGWHNLGKGLPNAIAFDLHFNYEDDLLVAGMLGRGAWTLPLYDDSPAVASTQSIQSLLPISSAAISAFGSFTGASLLKSDDVPMMPPEALLKKEF